MQFLDGGATGSNGRHSRGRPDDARSAPDNPEGSSGAHGSLMQRYRGAGTPPEAAPGTGAGTPAAPAPETRRADVNPPLPPPRPADASEGLTVADTERSWGKTTRPWSPSGTSAAAPAATPTPRTTPTPPSTASSPPDTTPTGAPATGGSGGAPATGGPSAGTRSGTTTGAGSTSPANGASAPKTGTAPAGPEVTVTRGASPGSSTPAPADGATVTRGTAPSASPSSTPSSTAAPTGTATLPAEQAADFKRRWREVQGDFVDDPRQAVRGADALAREILDALAAKIADKQRVEGWKAGEGAPTEDLRLALRQYRMLVDRLLEL